MSDERTRQYTGGPVPTTPVGIDIADALATRGGKLALLAAVNATTRNHPRLFVCAADVPQDRGPSIHETLAEIASTTETSQLDIVDSIPGDIPTIAIGAGTGLATVYVGADRFTATVGATPSSLSEAPSTVWGAALGAMRAANHVFRADIGLDPPAPESLSLWSLAPESGPSGPSDPGPIDVGSVWLVGAGGVGSSLAWWVHHIGVAGPWTVIDYERVENTNLNRSLGMFARDLTSDNGGPAYKSDIAAALIPNGVSFRGSWDAWSGTDPAPPDVLIPAANDLGVRGALATYSHPMAITGATSPNWTAELHVYRAGTDGCIGCRHPPMGEPAFACSTSTVPSRDGGSTDAALSFLSGTAALLCAAGLLRLQVGGLDSFNHWQMAFHPTSRTITTNKQSCEGGIAHALAADVREAYFATTRWIE